MDHSRAKYSLKSDRNEILSHNVKSVLLEQSPLRRKEYLMEKVSTRTEDQYMARDHQGKMALKLERNQVFLSLLIVKECQDMWIQFRAKGTLSSTRRSNHRSTRADIHYFRNAQALSKYESPD